MGCFDENQRKRELGHLEGPLGCLWKNPGQEDAVTQAQIVSGRERGMGDFDRDLEAGVQWACGELCVGREEEVENQGKS